MFQNFRFLSKIYEFFDNFEKFRFRTKFSKIFNFGQIFRKINFDFGKIFKKISICIKFSKNCEFGQNFE